MFHDAFTPFRETLKNSLNKRFGTTQCAILKGIQSLIDYSSTDEKRKDCLPNMKRFLSNYKKFISDHDEVIGEFELFAEDGRLVKKQKSEKRIKRLATCLEFMYLNRMLFLYFNIYFMGLRYKYIGKISYRNAVKNTIIVYNLRPLCHSFL